MSLFLKLFLVLWGYKCRERKAKWVLLNFNGFAFLTFNFLNFPRAPAIRHINLVKTKWKSILSTYRNKSFLIGQKKSTLEKKRLRKKSHCIFSTLLFFTHAPSWLFHIFSPSPNSVKKGGTEEDSIEKESFERWIYHENS